MAAGSATKPTSRDGHGVNHTLQLEHMVGENFARNFGTVALICQGSNKAGKLIYAVKRRWQVSGIDGVGLTARPPQVFGGAVQPICEPPKDIDQIIEPIDGVRAAPSTSFLLAKLLKVCVRIPICNLLQHLFRGFSRVCLLEIMDEIK